MKRIVIAFLCILFSAGMQAQIQTKFLGLELSKGYPTIESARDIIADRCERTEISDNKLCAFGVNFAGLKWERVTIDFYKTADTNIMYAVIFSHSNIHYNEIKFLYDSYLRALTNKYGQSRHNFWLSKDGKHTCLLNLDTKENEYILCLAYQDDEYLKLLEEIENSEL